MPVDSQSNLQATTGQQGVCFPVLLLGHRFSFIVGFLQRNRIVTSYGEWHYLKRCSTSFNPRSHRNGREAMRCQSERPPAFLKFS